MFIISEETAKTVSQVLLKKKKNLLKNLIELIKREFSWGHKWWQTLFVFPLPLGGFPLQYYVLARHN